MLILGIETSCDETSVAVVRDGTMVLSNVIASSRKTFEKLAGVIPEQAARMQVECMIPVLEEALQAAGVTMDQIDAIAVTRGPGLLGSLLVGTVTARTLASMHKKPLIGVHHTLGHLSSTWLTEGNFPLTSFHFPLLTLSASGGHTDLWYRSSHTKGRLLGRTRDDAAGEAFDKGASLLGLPYPGGPEIQKAAQTGNPKAHHFPLPLHEEDTLDFSFSGLKTSLKYLLRDVESRNPKLVTCDIAASFQEAICLHLLDRIKRAMQLYRDVREVHLVGGVSANTRLRELALALCEEQKLVLRYPSSLAYCTDNAAMIAAAGQFLMQESGELAYEKFSTLASLPLSDLVRS